jgi:hypothetical protein
MNIAYFKLIACLGSVLLLVSCTLGDQETLTDGEVLQIVKEDCSAWCKDNDSIIIEVNGYDERKHVTVGIRKESNNNPEAGYHVNPLTGEITRKYILNSEFEAIENGVNVSASQITDATFTKIDDLSYSVGTSGIMSVTSELGEIARYRGSLLALFGEPVQQSTNSEQAFTYVIKAQRSDGSKWVLTAYQGPSGFAIGGTASEKFSYEMAYLLKQKLTETTPSDFDKKDITYPDTGDVYSYGCKDAECYVE